MKHAIIDIGSNSIRLTVYEVMDKDFKILFKEKIMAGLAGYVENNALSDEGIRCACNALIEFRKTLLSLCIENVTVFATASLRNIQNTESVLLEIEMVTGFEVEIISGDEEALLGYYGAMREFDTNEGAFFDVGGASTEVVTFENSEPNSFVSYSIGSLSLYRSCVKKILPGNGSQKRIENEIIKKFEKKNKPIDKKYSVIVGVGGTSRAILKIAKKYFSLPDDCKSVSAKHLDELYNVLIKRDKKAIDLILKLEPDRIHTLVPGLMILRYIFKAFDSKYLLVSKYGVREGYLCKKIL